MKIDLFGDAFPDGLDEQEIKDAMDMIRDNERPSDDDLNLLAHEYVCLDEFIEKGIYDGKYMYVADTLAHASTVSADIVTLLGIYGIPFVEPRACEVNIPSRNIKIGFACLADIMDGEYDYFDADKIIMDLKFGIYEKDELEEIEKFTKKCLNGFGVLIGHITDPDVARFAHIAHSTSRGLQVGELRFNGPIVEVWDGASWITLKP